MTFALASSQTVARAQAWDNIVPFGTNIGNCFSHGICKADNSLHTVYTKYLGPRFNAAVFKTLGLSYATTDLEIDYVETPTSATDVIYRYGNLPAGALGRADCQYALDTQRCGQFIVTFDSDRICGDGCSDRTLREVACHETGHTVGLLHGANALPPVSNRLSSLGCMSKPTLWYAPREFLGPHNVVQINYSY